MRLPLVTLAILPAYTLAQHSRHRYQFRRQDDSATLHGDFVDYPAEVEQVEQGRQADRDSEPVPVVIKGLQILPQASANLQENSNDGQNKPAFSFDNDTTMNLDGPGYALSLLLLGEIIILGMAFFSGLGSSFGRSLDLFQVDQRNEIDPNMALELVESAATWLTNRFQILPDPPTIVF